ncbi:MAG TPA: helix-turn-helix domain-containing protein [Segeticoccus sp.]|nr:helix-turn-helix domain-containing protein [Segeticoccus sp.]
MTDDVQVDSGLGRELARLGALVRQRRTSRGLSVETLADVAGLSAGIVSMIERGRGNPSLSTLQKLAASLDLPLGQFFQGPRTKGLVVRADARKKLHPTEGLVYELLTPDLNRQLEMLRIQIPPGWNNRNQPFQHRGEECVHLVSGWLQIHVGGEDFELRSGDTITYDPSLPHWYDNPSGEAAHTLGVVTPPSF